MRFVIGGKEEEEDGCDVKKRKREKKKRQERRDRRAAFQAVGSFQGKRVSQRHSQGCGLQLDGWSGSLRAVVWCDLEPW